MRNVVLEDVPHGDQGAVGDRDGGLFGAATAHYPRVEARQVGVVGARSRPCRLDQGAPEPLVALARLAGFPLAGALVVPGTEGRPGGEMRRRGETVHLDPD